MRTKLMMLMLVLLGVMASREAQAFYNPITGRWLSRDPVEEKGGINLYGFVRNDSVDFVDMFGLDGLEFTSDGEWYEDRNAFHSYGRGNASHVKQSSDAWFWQSANALDGGCNGGLCNSDFPHPSSFVRARVKNTDNCPVTVTCVCSITWYGSTTTYGQHKTGGFGVNGNVLGNSFLHRFTPEFAGDGKTPGNVWVAAAAGTELQTATFTLAKGASKELYFGEVVIAVPPNMPGAGFSDGMEGSCSCCATSCRDK